jgi:hypothetical protein
VAKTAIVEKPASMNGVGCTEDCVSQGQRIIVDSTQRTIVDGTEDHCQQKGNNKKHGFRSFVN